MNLKTKTTLSIPNALVEKINLQQGQRLKRLIDRAVPAVNKDLKDLILTRLRAGVIYQGLKTGAEFGGVNLRAEFGLTEGMAEDAARELHNLVENAIDSINITGEPNRQGIKFILSYDGFDTEQLSGELEENPYFSYNNKEKGGKVNVEIMWMDWLLNGVAQTIDEAITYELSGKDEARSRSNRAIMVSAEDPRFNYPYRLPDQYLPKGESKNFLEEIIKSNIFKGLVKTKMRIALQTIISQTRK